LPSPQGSQRVSQPESTEAVLGKDNTSKGKPFTRKGNNSQPEGKVVARPKPNSNPLQYHYATWAYSRVPKGRLSEGNLGVLAMRRGHIIRIIGFSENLKFIIPHFTS